MLQAQLALESQQHPEPCFLPWLLPDAAHLNKVSTSKLAVPCRFSFLLACGPEVLQQMVQSEVPGDILADLLKAIHTCWRLPCTSAASSPEAPSSRLQSLSLQDSGQVTDAGGAVEGSAAVQLRDGECAGLGTCVAGARGESARGSVPAAGAGGCCPGGLGAVGLLAVWQEPARLELAGALAGWLVQGQWAATAALGAAEQG